MQKQFQKPSPADIQNCFLRFVFGYESSYLNASISTAYGDFSRTLHGISKNEASALLREKARKLLHDAIKAATLLETQDSFDVWHKETCLALQESYRAGGFDTFYIGQAQKWINMSIKYFALLGSLLGDQAVPGGSSLFDVGHVPIDSFVVSALKRKGLPSQLCIDSWSRIVEYDKYMEFQKWVRKEFQGSKPLAVEFELWQEEIVLAQAPASVSA
jgi:hypothetical protein